MALVPEPEDADVERRPFRDRARHIVPIVVGHQRRARGASVVLRRIDQEVHHPVRLLLRPPDHTFRQPFPNREGMDVEATRAQGPVNLLVDLGRMEHVLHDVEGDHDVESLVEEGLILEVLVAQVPDELTRRQVRKKVRRDVPRRL